MKFKINNQLPLELVTLEQAKQQVRLMDSFSLDDAYLNGLISTCSHLAQSYCNRLLTAGNITAVFPSYNRKTVLWGGEVTAVLTVTAVNSVNEVVDVDFEFSTITQEVTIPVEFAYHNNFTITYDCGYIALPPQVENGVLMLLSTMYNTRDDHVTGVTVATMPITSTRILDSVRHYR